MDLSIFVAGTDKKDKIGASCYWKASLKLFRFYLETRGVYSRLQRSLIKKYRHRLHSPLVLHLTDKIFRATIFGKSVYKFESIIVKPSFKSKTNTSV